MIPFGATFIFNIHNSRAINYPGKVGFFSPTKFYGFVFGSAPPPPFTDQWQTERTPGGFNSIHCLCPSLILLPSVVGVLWCYSPVFSGRHGAGTKPGCSAACFPQCPCSPRVVHLGVKTSFITVLEFAATHKPQWVRRLSPEKDCNITVLKQFCSLPLCLIW